MKTKQIRTVALALVLMGVATALSWTSTAQTRTVSPRLYSLAWPAGHRLGLSGAVQAQGSGTPQAGQAAGGASDPRPSGEFKPGEILVKLRAGLSGSTVESTLVQYRVTSARHLYRSDVALWVVPEGQELAIVKQLNDDPSVAYAEPNYLYHAMVTPNDPGFGNQWAHVVIQSPAAWDIITGSAAVSITVAIIDSGIDETHPDLSKIVSGYDFVDDDDDPHDLNGHGTLVAGVAAAATDNHIGIAGMSWGASVMPIRVLDAGAQGDSADITEGITWAYTHGADVINLSLGGPDRSQAMQDAIDAAHAAGSLVVAAIGNSRAEGNPTAYPAAFDHVMAVAATNRYDQYAWYSQYGPHCDISAPGGDLHSILHHRDGIYSTMPTYSVGLTKEGYHTGYDYGQGTSQAAPFVSGLAALVWSMDPLLTADEVQDLIQSSAVDLGPAGWDPDYGHGRINALDALRAVTLPPAVQDLHVTYAAAETGIMTATLDWTAPQKAVTVTLRYSSTVITEANWSMADLLTDTLSGDAETYVATVPYDGHTVYFALRSQNAGGDWSDLSNNAYWPPAAVIYLPCLVRDH